MTMIPCSFQPSDLLVADAASELGISASRVRFLRRFGVLTATTIGSRHAVTAESVRRLAADLQVRRSAEAAARARSRRPRLRLVVDNS